MAWNYSNSAPCRLTFQSLYIAILSAFYKSKKYIIHTSITIIFRGSRWFRMLFVNLNEGVGGIAERLSLHFFYIMNFVDVWFDLICKYCRIGKWGCQGRPNCIFVIHFFSSITFYIHLNLIHWHKKRVYYAKSVKNGNTIFFTLMKI